MLLSYRRTFHVEAGQARGLPYGRSVFAGDSAGRSLAASAEAPNLSPIASAIQTSQCEKNPVEMGNVSVHPKSAVRRHKPITNATSAEGVTSATKTSAAWAEVATVRLTTACNRLSGNADTGLTAAGSNTSSILVTGISSPPMKLDARRRPKFLKCAHTGTANVA